MRFFRNLKAQNPTLVGKKFVVKQTYIEAMLKSFGKTALFANDLTPATGNDEVRDGAHVP